MTDLVALDMGEIATLRLTNPPLNLVTLELTAQLGEVLKTLSEARDVLALVVAGNERAFCAGSDIGEFESLHGRVAEGKLLREGDVYRMLARLPLPTVAAIEGNALGGGLELALCCDLRVASATALLGLPEVTLGAIPGSGGTQRLTRLVGPGRAKEMILLGELVSAEQAMRLGLVERVAPKGAAEEMAFDIAKIIAKRAPLAVREAKRLIDESLDIDLDAGLSAELDSSRRVFASEDILEGAKAFKEKREPRFRGS